MRLDIQQFTFDFLNNDDIKRLNDPKESLEDQIEILGTLAAFKFKSEWNEYLISLDSSEATESKDINIDVRSQEFQAFEKIFTTIASDTTLDVNLRSVAMSLLASKATEFFPQSSGTPLDDPYMKKAIFWSEQTLNNREFREKDRIVAAQWLVSRYLKRLPQDADINHEYAQKMITNANVILLDKTILPMQKKNVAALVALFYEHRVVDGTETDENAKKSKEYQAYIVRAYEEEDAENSDTGNDEALNLSESKSTSEQPKKQTPTDYSYKLFLLGFRKTNASAYEKIKLQLMDETEHLCWSDSMDQLLKLVDQEDAHAIKILAEVVEYHLQAIMKKIPDFVQALKTKTISQTSLCHQISHYQYGRSGHIALHEVYRKLGCSHLRELHYLAKSGHTGTVPRYEGYSVAKTAVMSFYQRLAEACQENGIDSTFNQEAMKYVEAPGKSKSITTIIYDIIKDDNLEIFSEKLTNKEFNLDFTMGDTPLLIEAAQQGSEKIFNFLLNQGADPKIQTKDKNALIAVCQSGGAFDVRHAERLRMAQTLIDKGIDVNAFEGSEYTALHLAALYEFNEMIHLLIKYRAKVDSKDLLGRTPLYLLIEQHRERSSMLTIRILCQYRADVNAFSRIGMRPITLAAMYPNIQTLLLKYDSGDEVLSENESNLKELLEFGANLGMVSGMQPGDTFNEDNEFTPSWDSSSYLTEQEGEENISKLINDLINSEMEKAALKERIIDYISHIIKHTPNRKGNYNHSNKILLVKFFQANYEKLLDAENTGKLKNNIIKISEFFKRQYHLALLPYAIIPSMFDERENESKNDCPYFSENTQVEPSPSLEAPTQEQRDKMTAAIDRLDYNEIVELSNSFDIRKYFFGKLTHNEDLDITEEIRQDVLTYLINVVCEKISTDLSRIHALHSGLKSFDEFFACVKKIRTSSFLKLTKTEITDIFKGLPATKEIITKYNLDNESPCSEDESGKLDALIKSKEELYNIIFSLQLMCINIYKISKQIIILFLKKGVDINPSHGESSPLCAAIENGDEELVQFLISNGANINGGVINPSEHKDGSDADHSDNNLIPLLSLMKTQDISIAKNILFILLDNNIDLEPLIDEAFTECFHNAIKLVIFISKYFEIIREIRFDFLRGLYSSAENTRTLKEFSSSSIFDANLIHLILPYHSKFNFSQYSISSSDEKRDHSLASYSDKELASLSEQESAPLDSIVDEAIKRVLESGIKKSILEHIIKNCRDHSKIKNIKFRFVFAKASAILSHPAYDEKIYFLSESSVMGIYDLHYTSRRMRASSFHSTNSSTEDDHDVAHRQDSIDYNAPSSSSASMLGSSSIQPHIERTSLQTRSITTPNNSSSSESTSSLFNPKNPSWNPVRRMSALLGSSPIQPHIERTSLQTRSITTPNNSSSSESTSSLFNPKNPSRNAMRRMSALSIQSTQSDEENESSPKPIQSRHQKMPRRDSDSSGHSDDTGPSWTGLSPI